MTEACGGTSINPLRNTFTTTPNTQKFQYFHYNTIGSSQQTLENLLKNRVKTTDNSNLFKVYKSENISTYGKDNPNLPTIKSMITYALCGTADDLITNDLNLKNHIDALTSSELALTDFIAGMYVLCLAMETNGICHIRDAFTGDFTQNLKKFLEKDINIPSEQIKKISNRCLKNIYYNGGVFIKFNLVKIDLSILLGERLFNGYSGSIKSSELRKVFTAAEIKQKKQTAENYFNRICEQQINHLRGSADKDDQRQKLIIMITWFIKFLDPLMRHQVETEMNFEELFNLIPQHVIEILKLDTPEKKSELLTHCMFLAIHQNNQIWAKRLFVKLPFIGVIVAGCTCMAMAMGLNAVTGWMLLKFLGVKIISAGGNGMEAGSHALNVYPEVKKAALHGGGAITNGGDRLQTRPTSEKRVLATLANCYDGNVEDQSGTTLRVNKHYTSENYTSAEPWKKLPKVETLLDLLQDEEITNKGKVDIFNEVSNKVYESGYNYRYFTSLKKLIIKPGGTATKQDLQTIQAEIQTLKEELQTTQIALQVAQQDVETLKQEQVAAKVFQAQTEKTIQDMQSRLAELEHLLAKIGITLK